MNTAVKPPGVSSEEALPACVSNAPMVVGVRTNASVGDDTTQANPGFETAADKEAEVAHTTLERGAPLLQGAELACMPGAYQVPGPGPGPATATDSDSVGPLHVMVDEEEERPSVNTGIAVSNEQEDQQQSAQTNIVSAYRVTEEEPAIIATATPFKDIKFRFLMYGVLLATAVIALIVGLSVGLTTSSKEGPPGDSPKEESPSDSLGRLVSSLRVSADDGSFVKADRYSKTEDGREIATTVGNGVLNSCEVLPCKYKYEDCDIYSYGNFYEPGCCLGDDCNPSDKCGATCPRKRNVCYPAYERCRDASCYDCERGPNGEVIYQYTSTSYNLNCLRTGVAIGFNDKDDNVERIYKWAIGCGYIVHGGYEWANLATGEYACIAVRSGEGITKTVSQPVPCQLIQYGECGCGPEDMHTFGLPLPDKPCKIKQDCTYLCGDAGEDEAKTLCEAFPGIEWWETENPLYQDFFYDPEEYPYRNVTIEIDILENRYLLKSLEG